MAPNEVLGRHAEIDQMLGGINQRGPGDPDEPLRAAAVGWIIAELQRMAAAGDLVLADAPETRRFLRLLEEAVDADQAFLSAVDVPGPGYPHAECDEMWRATDAMLATVLPPQPAEGSE